MRDINRIDRICNKLNRLWHEHPDKRFGQLLFNYILSETNYFYQEDDITEFKIDKAISVLRTLID